MSEPLRKPVMRVRVGGEDLFSARELTVKGRDAWALRKLIERGEGGITALDEIGPRLSHYIFKLRRAGIVIETKEEVHGGAFAGWHGRYILRSKVDVIEGGELTDYDPTEKRRSAGIPALRVLS
jgi:hypothetical protein